MPSDATIATTSLVICDPPYDHASLGLWNDLGRWAAKALRPGSLLIAYSGALYLPEVMARLGEHLEYVWLGHLFTPGNTRLAAWSLQINQRAKPILLYSNRPYQPTGWINDTLHVGGERHENLHRWQQSVGP